MFKRIRRSLLKKFYGGNPSLDRMLRSGFKNHPIMATITALYVFPVRNILESLYSSEFLHKYTFTASNEYYREIHELLHVSKAEGHELIRVGREYDGGYIMLDDLPGGIAYSFGISDDVSWDKDMASRGYDVFMYDHTIDGLPEENARFHWSKLGIADGVSLDERLKTLEELISMNHHENERDMILKMDVEGAEWGFLESVKPETLAQFSQILFEFHGMNKTGICGKIPGIIQKISQTHKLIHLHGQNWGFYVCTGGKTFCNQIEVTYVRKDKYSFIDDYDVRLPTDIDMPAISDIPEVELGFWNRNIQDDDNNFSLVTVRL